MTKYRDKDTQEEVEVTPMTVGEYFSMFNAEVLSFTNPNDKGYVVSNKGWFNKEYFNQFFEEIPKAPLNLFSFEEANILMKNRVQNFNFYNIRGDKFAAELIEQSGYPSYYQVTAIS